MSQFDEVMRVLERLEDRLEKLILSLGPRIDQQEFQRGLEVDPMGWREGQIFDDEAVIDIPEEPRTRVEYKTNQGGVAYAKWDSLPEDMQMMIEIARTYPGEWQLYEDPSGGMRIMVDPQAEQEFRRRKLGNQIGK